MPLIPRRRLLAFSWSATRPPRCAMALLLTTLGGAGLMASRNASAQGLSVGEEDIPEIDAATPRPIVDEAAPTVPKPGDGRAATPRAAKPRPWSGSLGSNYLGNFDAADPFLLWDLGVRRQLGSEAVLFAEQKLIHNIYVDASRQQFELQDSRFGLLVQQAVPSEGTLSLSLSSSLPISKASQANSIYTQPGLGARIVWPWSDRMEVMLAADLRYTASVYETAQTNSSQGGEPLPLLQAKLAHGSSFALSSIWSVGYSLAYAEILYHEVSYEGPVDTAIDQQPAQAYEVGLGLDCSPTAWLDLGFSYSQGSLLSQAGFDDYVVFDSLESVWAFSIKVKTRQAAP